MQLRSEAACLTCYSHGHAFNLLASLAQDEQLQRSRELSQTISSWLNASIILMVVSVSQLLLVCFLGSSVVFRSIDYLQSRTEWLAKQYVADQLF